MGGVKGAKGSVACGVILFEYCVERGVVGTGEVSGAEGVDSRGQLAQLHCGHLKDGRRTFGASIIGGSTISPWGT